MDGTLVASSSSSSTSRHIGRWTYDVFLSFRGEDTRKNFVDHLYAALDQAGIYTFKDDQKLQRGESISPSLLKAIEESMVAVVVFSKNYANSSWCLDELVKIVECQHLGQRVLPVFYDVDPSDVRGQKGSFHAAFEQHELKLTDDTNRVNRWKEALVTSASISGWDVPQTASGHEAECIKQIVRRILSYNEFLPAENLIGMESRVRDVKSLLRKGDNDVLMIGIWGMGGIGKTTIARAVYHQISYEFKGSSFLEAVRENGSDEEGLKSLQEKLLSEILVQENFHVKDCHDGICHIRRRLSRNKVLVVLDDVDDFKQLEFLAGAREWFGPGSRIILTTRDEHLLWYVQDKYTPELLKQQEAMTLFSRYAFKANFPPKTYEELSGVVVSHSGHLPLALKALGSHFCGRNLDFWQSGLNVLAKIPHKEINGILKLSYDGLNMLEKKIFLYIACFFKGKERANVTRVLDSLGFEATSGITVLIEKSLLTISNECLHMHDLIQEMGRFVVRECYASNMVWLLDEIKEVMTTITRSETVEAMVDTTSYHFSDTPMAHFSPEVFKTMKKLRLLGVKGKFTLSEPKYFPKDLRWLCWYQYPFQSLRINSGMTKLVGLEMQCSELNQLQIQNKVILPNLKVMDLSFSCSITSFPDISGVPNLERLNLSFCSELVDVHQSVLLHQRIICLQMSCCVSLKILASHIHMKSLETLHLNGCTSLERFPEVSQLSHLKYLNLSGCGDLKELHGVAPLIQVLVANSCTSLQMCDGLFTETLHLNGCTSLERFPEVSQLSHLKYLNLSGCGHLKKLHGLPPLIQVLVANSCPSLQKGCLFTDYKWLFKISLIYSSLIYFGPSFRAPNDLNIKNLVKKCAAVNHQLSITVRARGFPEFFNICGRGQKFALKLPQTKIKEIKGLAMCCQVYPTAKGDINLKIMFGSAVEGKFIRPVVGTDYFDQNTHLWMGYIPVNFLMKLCAEIDLENLVINFRAKEGVGECGVCVVYKDDIGQGTEIESYNPDQIESQLNVNYGVFSEDLKSCSMENGLNRVF